MNRVLSPAWSLQPWARGPQVYDLSAAGQCWFELSALFPGAEGKLVLEQFLFSVALL